MDGFYAQETFDADLRMPINEGTPSVENIVFKNITAETVAGRGLFLCGLPESPFRNVRFENVRVKGIKEPYIKNIEKYDRMLTHSLILPWDYKRII